jgi:hypothetical protein
VREWLKGLPEAERQAVGKDLLRAQWRWPVGMPLCRPMGTGLWEIRTDLPTKRTARAREAGVDAGGDIMIHGLRDGVRIPGDWTQGCIAVTDEEMDEIWGLVGEGTAIRIGE